MNRRTFLGFLSGSLAGVVLGFVTLPLMAWVFTPTDLGRLNMLLTVAWLSVTVSALGLDQAYMREFHEVRDKPQLFFSVLLPGLLLLTVGSATALAYSGRTSELLYGLDNTKLLWITIAIAISSFLSRFCSLILRMQERGLAYSASQVAPRAVTAIAILPAIWNQSLATFEYLAVVTLGSTISVVALYAWSTRAHWLSVPKGRDVVRLQRSLLRYSVPLMVSAIGYWALTSSGALFLRTFSTFHQLGLYSIAISCSAIAVALQLTVSTVWAPIIFRWGMSTETATRINQVISQALPLAALTISMAGTAAPLVGLILPDSYSAIPALLACVMIQPVMFTLGEVTGAGLTLARRTLSIASATLLACALNAGICVALIPEYGAAGAVIANSLSFWAYFVLRTEASSRLWHPLRRRRMYGTLGALTVLAVLNALLVDETRSVSPFVWAIVSLGVVISSQEQLLETLRMLRGDRAVLART